MPRSLVAFFIPVVLLLIVSAWPLVAPQPAAADDDPMQAPFFYEPVSDEDAAHAELIRTAVFGWEAERHAALAELVAQDAKDAMAALIVGMRHVVIDDEVRIALSELAGEPINNWHDAMRWQERNPQVKAHPVAREIRLRVFMRRDARFMRFLGGARSMPETMRIRLDEIVWGGVMIGDIPTLDDPIMWLPDNAAFMEDDNLVFGVSINGDTRAYPLRILAWHEMVNAIIGDVPVSLAFCTLCGAGILFETAVEGFDKPFTFGTSGLLYRSNKLMYDRQTDSLWNQFSGEPVTGPLAFSGIRLKVRPIVLTTWGAWLERHPDTTVLSPNTGHLRDYSEGAVYADYFASPDLMFPVNVGDESVVARKDQVFGVRDVGIQKAWPIAAFTAEPVINDAIGDRALVLVGDEAGGGVRAYERGDRTFVVGPSTDTLVSGDQSWRITETALVSPDGTRLDRVAGHIAYWFAWDSYFGVTSELYGPQPVR
ncbi:MAG: DUF3179 domain-containing protein [Roseitalea sp.]|jgi:hypothetical protein|nr:DUF3179 domain-containing protein [Roseitalea sp.]MBO6723117.1 DUF3179 domain-containing protein [Roseitalea sp.]MBO6742445.1 DUF3179 domain-containing protein [Roseitalea sp.]